MRSAPVSARVMSNAAATRPGPAARRAAARWFRREAARDALRGVHRPPGRSLDAGGPHRGLACEGFDGANQHGSRSALGLRHDVQALVHAVHEVDVGDPGRPVHHGVAGRLPEPGVGCEIVLADVRLDLHDPPDALAGRPVVADEVGADERSRGVEGRSDEDLPREAAPQGQRRASRAPAALANASRTSCGNRKPSTASSAGITLLRRISAVSDVSNSSWTVRRKRELASADASPGRPAACSAGRGSGGSR